MKRRALFTRFALPLLFIVAVLLAGLVTNLSNKHVLAADPVTQAFDQASQEFGVPASILKALCYMEGHLSDHGGSPSIDGGYGCMHLIKNHEGDTLDRAAKELEVNAQQIK